MTKTTEIILCIVAILVGLWVTWNVAERTFMSIVNANRRAVVAEQRAAAAEQKLFLFQEDKDDPRPSKRR